MSFSVSVSCTQNITEGGYGFMYLFSIQPAIHETLDKSSITGIFAFILKWEYGVQYCP